jgi:hypothetical protein
MKNVDESKGMEQIASASSENTYENNPISSCLCELNNITEKLQTLLTECKTMLSIGKKLEKDFCMLQKSIIKKYKPKEDNKRTMNGFATPVVLSEEMYNFMNITKGTKIPKKDVTIFINKYIDDHGLRDSTSREIIVPDEQLQRLFRSSDKDIVTYFNMQSYIKHHFYK